MANKKKKIVLPILAGIGLVVLLWLAFHDRSVAATLATPVQDVRPSRACGSAAVCTRVSSFNCSASSMAT